MSWLRNQRERILDRKANETESTADQAVGRLVPTLRELLARLEGQSLSDLQVTLQLLPLGSRLALDTVGAVELDGDNPVEGRYRLKVLPFCIEVVNAAVRWVEGERKEGRADSRTDEELAATLYAGRAGGEGSEVPASRLDETAHAVEEPVLVEQAQQLAADQTLVGILTDLYKEEPKIGPQSPSSVADRTGLPVPTVGHTMDRLLETGWLSRVSSPRSQEPQFSLSDNRGLMIGMSLTGNHVHAVLTSLRATRVIGQREHSLSDSSPRNIVRTVVNLAQDLQGEAGVGQDIVGLGVVLAGRVDRTGTVYFAPDLETAENRWNEVALEAELEEATRVTAFNRIWNRVVVENDANALGMYEYLLQGADESVVVVLMSESGKGIGGGLVINGAIAHGVEGVSGEIGHVVVDPDGEPCRCGAHGCLETVASSAAIVEKIKKTTAMPIASLTEASALAERGDQAATKVFASAGQALGGVLSTVTAIVGPRHLVIFGPPQLTKESDVTSAHTFLRGVRQTHAPVLLGVKVDVLPKVLDPVTLPTAAAATAVHHFLSRPRRWMPTIVQLDVPIRPMALATTTRTSRR